VKQPKTSAKAPGHHVLSRHERNLSCSSYNTVSTNSNAK